MGQAIIVLFLAFAIFPKLSESWGHDKAWVACVNIATGDWHWLTDDDGFNEPIDVIGKVTV